MRNVSCANPVGDVPAADNRRLPPPERRPVGKRPQDPSAFLSLSPHPRSLILMGCCAGRPVGSHLPSPLNDWRVGTRIHAIKYGGVASGLAPRQTSIEPVLASTWFWEKPLYSLPLRFEVW